MGWLMGLMSSRHHLDNAPGPPGSADGLLLETGDFFLLETGDFLVLE